MADPRLDGSPLSECLVDGRSADGLSVLDRGLAYGDGLFETLRVVNGRIPLLEYHLARLQRGLDALRLTVDLPTVVEEVNALAARLQSGVVKLIVTRGAGKRGYAIPNDAQSTRIVQGLAQAAYDPEHGRSGVRLFECETRLALQPRLAGIKHLNRLEQVLARSEWSDPSYAEGLVRDMQGNVIECTMSNLFMFHHDRWITPDLSASGVRGVMRDYLIGQLQEAGQRVEVRQIDDRTLLDSAEVFCCNSLYGVWPVIGLADHLWPVGTRTRQVQALAQQVLV